jgi:hypothetical protein
MVIGEISMVRIDGRILDEITSLCSLLLKFARDSHCEYLHLGEAFAIAYKYSVQTCYFEI